MTIMVMIMTMMMQAGTHKEAGWPSSTYFVSKIGWSALSRYVMFTTVCEFLTHYDLTPYTNPDPESSRG